ncbi:hypothetical protein G3578_16325 [Brevibacillus sp. SYP-B805]|uniref:hypothetical protein n=1 Tax=Brevibacillus sp. SYP-B805 TaxID=1578199 RepID=UPI0013EAD4BD|nr:hypothetical protein [Brevibacillus sp. SYP-B805]NGQ96732.1 hypothetical protein [Brevibacillus sp. SYP-B805]
MDKWVMAAMLYVAVLIGGFTVYDQFWADGKQTAAAEMDHNEEPHADMNGSSSHEHGSDSQHEGSSEVSAFVQADKDELKIFLKDKAGNPVDELAVNHEKLLHLIIVDETLQKYYHLHPEQTGKGEFHIANPLPAGFYKAFIDIKPKNLAYHAAPVPFVVGHPSAAANHQPLQPDTALIQQVDGETVTLHMSSFQTNQPVTLSFDLDQTNLTPYLGAMGHVVILDEYAQNYLHVHPANDHEPVFETQFNQPGIYKIWAEFQQNGKVRAFPFVVEIKGEN